jgi:glucoamylase
MLPTLLGLVVAVSSFAAQPAQQEAIALRNLMSNLEHPGIARGAVIASPSRRDPDYFFHWVRDAGLTMDVIVTRYMTTSGAEKQRYFGLLMDFARFSRGNQLTPNPSGDLGEPKFHVDGSAFNGPWGRPQNDGPAIRATTLARLAIALLDEGREDLVRRELYSPQIPAYTVIKADLEFVAHHWREPSFDLWEEIKGQHFYTRMVQRRSMVVGARLARRLGDGGAAAFYEQQAAELARAILWHWDDRMGYFRATLDRTDGIDYKHSGLDSAVILGVLHGYADDGFLAPTDPRVLATARAIDASFGATYDINRQGRPGLATAIGRYPEDRYDGYGTSGQGNPWFLATHAFAELYYRAGLPDVGDRYMARSARHTAGDGSMSEQMNRWSGYMQGAQHLTWSYASYLTAAWAR